MVMATWSPTLEGFRVMFRRPSLSLAEIMWRWSFGAAACILLGLGFIEYLDTLPVSNADRLLLRTRHPLLISQAFSHILHGSALRFAFASIVLFSALALLWVVISAVGRGATLRPLLDYIQERARSVDNQSAADSAISEPHAEDDDEPRPGRSVRSLAGLNFLRAALALAACAGILGSLIISGFASSATHPHPGMVFLLSSLLVVLVWMIWSSASWFLSVASIFVVRQGADTFAALSDAVDFCRDSFGPVMTVGTWFGLTHLVLFVVATSVVSFPLAFAQVVPIGIVLSAVLLLTLAYFAIVDTLYIGRLAAYVAIVEGPEEPEAAPVLPLLELPGTQHSAVSTQPESAMVDQDETILSDHPLTFVDGTQPSALDVPTATARVDAEEEILSGRPEKFPPDDASREDL